MPGEQYLPPLQSVWKKYCAFRSALSRKSTVEVPSDVAGIVTEVLVKKGDTVKVGQVLARAPCGDVANFSSVPGVAPERRV